MRRKNTGIEGYAIKDWRLGTAFSIGMSGT
jgi:hypothetical protein